MIYNQFNRFQRLFAEAAFEEQVADPGAGGAGGEEEEVSMADALATFLGDDAPDPNAGDVIEESKKDDVAAAGEIEEEEFPEIGAPAAEKTEEVVDEFDTEAEKREKGLNFTDQKAADHWKWLKTQAKEAKNAAKELEAKLLEASSAQKADPKEVETLKETIKGLEARNEELRQSNDQTAVRESTEFIENITNPLKEMAEILGTIAEAREISVDDLEDAVMETNPAKQDQMLDALQAKLGSRMASRVERIADDYKKVKSLEANMLKDAGKKLEESRMNRVRESEQAEAVRVSAFRNAVSENFTALASRIPGFTDSNGHLTDLGKAAAAKASATEISKLAPADLAYMLFCVSGLPKLREAYRKMETELSLARAGKPSSLGLETSGSPSANQVDHDDPEAMSLADRMAKETFTFTPPS